jgi:ketosteroid isomerase-like protein
MRSLAVGIVSAVVLCFPANRASCELSQQKMDSGVEQILKIDEARWLAMLHNDVATLQRLLADDVVIFWGDGSVDTKARALAALRSRQLSYDRIDYQGTRVRLYGSAAVVTGRAMIRYRSEGRTADTVCNVTRVYAQRQGEWQLVASQTTRIPQTHRQTTQRSNQPMKPTAPIAK